MNKTIGIAAYGIAVPLHRLPVVETVQSWNNTSAALVEKQFGVTERTVLGSDEDTLTLACEAARRCLTNFGNENQTVDSVFFGTVTGSELYRGCANSLMDMLSGNTWYFGQDVAAAEKSGVESLLNAYSRVVAGLSDSSLAVGADCMCRHTAPGDLRESYEGAGAAAMLVGGKDIIAEITGAYSYNTNLPEFGRPEDERFIRSLMPMDSGTLQIGILEHTKSAIEGFLNKYGSKLDDYDYIVPPQSYPGEVYQIARFLGFRREKIMDSLFSDKTGDIGSASSLVALAKVIECSKPGEKILLCTYGHNAGSEVVSLKVTDEILRYRNNLQNPIKDCLERRREVSYFEALKYEYKLVAPNISFGAFN